MRCPHRRISPRSQRKNHCTPGLDLHEHNSKFVNAEEANFESQAYGATCAITDSCRCRRCRQAVLLHNAYMTDDIVYRGIQCASQTGISDSHAQVAAGVQTDDYTPVTTPASTRAAALATQSTFIVFSDVHRFLKTCIVALLVSTVEPVVTSRSAELISTTIYLMYVINASGSCEGME